MTFFLATTPNVHSVKETELFSFLLLSFKKFLYILAYSSVRDEFSANITTHSLAYFLIS